MWVHIYSNRLVLLHNNTSLNSSLLHYYIRYWALNRYNRPYPKPKKMIQPSHHSDTYFYKRVVPSFYEKLQVKCIRSVQLFLHGGTFNTLVFFFFFFSNKRAISYFIKKRYNWIALKMHFPFNIVILLKYLSNTFSYKGSCQLVLLRNNIHLIHVIS